MLVQHPKTGVNPVAQGTIDDYRKMHRVYIRLYKRLHEQVAAFSILPEKFVAEVEPVIEKYLEVFASSPEQEQQIQSLQVITEFTTRFHSFMDEATEMFADHQLLSDETYLYLRKVGELDAQNIPASEQAYIQLIPEIEHLLNSLTAVKALVNSTHEHIKSLEPSWAEIKTRISTR